MLDQLLQVDPKRRITVTQLLFHPWVLQDCNPGYAVEVSTTFRFFLNWFILINSVYITVGERLLYSRAWWWMRHWNGSFSWQIEKDDAQNLIRLALRLQYGHLFTSMAKKTAFEIYPPYVRSGTYSYVQIPLKIGFSNLLLDNLTLKKWNSYKWNRWLFKIYWIVIKILKVWKSTWDALVTELYVTVTVTMKLWFRASPILPYRDWNVTWWMRWTRPAIQQDAIHWRILHEEFILLWKEVWMMLIC